MSVYWNGFLVGSMFGICLSSVIASARMVVHHWRKLRQEQRQLADMEDVTRILTGLEVPAPQDTLVLDARLEGARRIAHSPLAGYQYAGGGRHHRDPDDATDEAPSVEQDKGPGGLRGWLSRHWAATAPRTPEQVALVAYERAVLAHGETYDGSHRSDGYTPHEVNALNTATGEFPSLRYLRRGWNYTKAPVPAEVFV